MIKKLIDWITGKSDKPAEAPYKVEAPKVADVTVSTEAVTVVPEAVVPSAIETAPVTVKAKYKKADLNKMTKAQLMELVNKHGVEVKARSTKEELVKVLAKV
jgi:cytoskeletal protein RodZ